jgi:hypothetical protein
MENAPISSADRQQVRLFFVSAAVSGGVGILLAYCASFYIESIEIEGVTVGVTLGLLNLVALRIVVATLLGIVANQTVGVLILLLKAPLMLLCVWFIARESTSYIYSTLAGVLVFIPAGFITAYLSPGDPESNEQSSVSPDCQP